MRNTRRLGPPMIERFLLLWLTLLSAVALFWTDWFSDGFDPFVGSRPVLDWLIVATMLAIGSLLPRDEVRNVVSRWPLVLGGTAVQYISMPLLAVLVTWLFDFDTATATGIIMAGCVPGAR